MLPHQNILTEEETQELLKAIKSNSTQEDNRMDELTTVNNTIAVEPFPSSQAEKEVRNGIAMVKQKHTLQQLKVVFGDNEKYSPGRVVWVRADQCIANWAKEVFEVESKKFILLPKDQIVLVGR